MPPGPQEHADDDRRPTAQPIDQSALPLSKLKKFGRNPGRLKARIYIPDELISGAALVVALHGSKQSANDYANGAGWAHYAKQHGFALLLPEQRRSNNPLLSFNWVRYQTAAPAARLNRYAR